MIRRNPPFARVDSEESLDDLERLGQRGLDVVGAADFLATVLIGEVVPEGHAAVPGLAPGVEHLRQRHAAALVKSLAPFQFLQVKKGERLDGTGRLQSFGSDLLADVGDRERVYWELAAADHHREDSDGGYGQRRVRGLRVV